MLSLIINVDLVISTIEKTIEKKGSDRIESNRIGGENFCKWDRKQGEVSNRHLAVHLVRHKRRRRFSLLLSRGRISLFSQIGEQMLTQFQVRIGPPLALPKLLTRIRDERQVRAVVTPPPPFSHGALPIEIYARNTILLRNTCKLRFFFLKLGGEELRFFRDLGQRDNFTRRACAINNRYFLTLAIYIWKKKNSLHLKIKCLNLMLYKILNVDF